MPIRRVDLNDYTIDPRQAATDAAGVLREGGVVALPTETVYGLAAKPDVAVARDALATLRGGATGPLTPHLAEPTDLSLFDIDPGEAGSKLVQKLWPGPVALVFEQPDEAKRQAAAKSLGLAEGELFADDGRITLRCPDDPFAREVLRGAGQPTILTRAGLPKGPATKPPTVEELEPLGVNLLIDAGPTRYARPSTVIRVGADGSSWDVVREGIYDRRIVERLLRTTVLFVCSGNTCRSPMAMAMGRKILAKKLGVTVETLGDKGFEVISAGTGAMPGMRATPAAADAVADLGGDLSSHRSQPVDVALINRADLIITMGRGHRDMVEAMVPSAADKTMMLDPQGDIEDPIGSDAATYRRMAGRLEGLVQKRLDDAAALAG